MTPTEVTDAGNGYLAQYTASREALAALDRRIRSAGRSMEQLGRELAEGWRVKPDQTAPVLDALESLSADLADYRETRSTCAELLVTLEDLGRSSALKDISKFPER